MRDFRTLNLAVSFYQQAEQLKLPVHLKNQFSRATSSIVLNLAEGRGKSSKKDQLKFFDIAFGSLRESQSILLLVGEKDTKLWQELDILAAHLYKLIKHAK